VPGPFVIGLLSIRRSRPACVGGAGVRDPADFEDVDGGMLDVVGFDAAAPALIADFACEA